MTTVRDVAIVDIRVSNNVTWADAFQFGEVEDAAEALDQIPDVSEDDAADTSWSFTNQSFLMDLKVAATDAVAKLAMSSAGGTIVVDDVTLRILHFNVPDTTIQTLTVGSVYVYDLIMVDNSSGVRVALMTGTVTVTQGVTH